MIVDNAPIDPIVKLVFAHRVSISTHSPQAAEPRATVSLQSPAHTLAASGSQDVVKGKYSRSAPETKVGELNLNLLSFNI